MQTKKIHNSFSLLSFFLIITCLFLHFNATYAEKKRKIKDAEAIYLDCGIAEDSEDSDKDGRKWETDLKYIADGDKSNVRKAEERDPSLPTNEPYMTARMFTSVTTYKFPIVDTTKRILLRLVFYPSPYPHFTISNSFFSVTAGGVTLLSNFSALLTAQALSQAYVVKEYFLAPSNVPTLDVTFIPSDKYSLSFAFINGIEVIQTPQIFDEEPILVGLGRAADYSLNSHSISMHTVETMYRLNVGGPYLGPATDSGSIMRSWYEDTPYLYGGHAIGVSITTNSSIKYGALPPQIAPLQVYESCRTMGPSGEFNQHYNLTWIFRVDPNFSYIVRFHWCDFFSDKPNQRAFNIYINNETAQLGADVYTWTKQKLTPMIKDYSVYVRNNDREDAEIRVELHPAVSERPEFLDSLLNGLEIFKLNDAKSNLAGPNPRISDLMSKHLNEESKAEPTKTSYSTAIIGGAAGGFAAMGVAAVLCVVAYNRKKKLFNTDISIHGNDSTNWLTLNTGDSHTSSSSSSSSGTKSCSISGKITTATTTTTSHISSDAAHNCRYFSLAEVKKATNNFDESYVIGVGGFGKVYRGIIDHETQVAIKRSNPLSEQGVHEFQTEIELLSKLRHRHLVSLIGYCEEDNEMALVYDYMKHGTLREHLYKRNRTILSWKQRLEICIGAARGLHYLHTGVKYTVIHRDVKTTNILLDENWEAKVSDFGLSKTGPDTNQDHVSTVVKGSFGYLDPEYFRRQQLTEKSDVYSFGVVLFEVLCARPALNANLPKDEISLSDWALQSYAKGRLGDIIDPNLKGEISPECLKKFADTAVTCLSDHGVDRPSMGDVLWNLECALQLQDNPDAGAQGKQCKVMTVQGQGEDIQDHKNEIAMYQSTLSLVDDQSESNVFSQMVYQQGR